ncbi:phytochrome-like protein [Lentinula boryana]|uniref:Phytochrome-like protein n=1 Tax=Lentinula boryana TaxID=40481 RepID=A0ABQ8Q212_9AGAR|nr:phytochrome-like protein [Lentinula boryana]
MVHLASVSSSRGSSSNGYEPKFGSKSSESSSNSSSNLSNYYTPEEISSGDDSKDSSRQSSSKSTSDGNGRDPYSDRVSAHRDSEAPRVSVRFQHMRDEHGHHVITGREGQLMRCEDEPIRTPGAVQGFGVLIVVEEKEDALIVRQVSENSTELLGLPPRYLFSLGCFTDVLPKSQASLLWDNIQYSSDLSDAADVDGGDESERGSPDIFMLSGYGAPGTVIPGFPAPADPYDPWGLHEGNRRWTCWCAIHRPQPSPYPSNNKPKTLKSLIVMEFELEIDRFNPLYQSLSNPAPAASAPSGVESPDSIGSHSSDSTSSGSASGSLTHSGQSENQLMPVHGLNGDHGWTPSTEDIFESTTTRSKPLLALERLRRMSRMPGSLDSNFPNSSSSGRVRRALHQPNPGARAGNTTNASSGSVSMMDVFAVMAQINEQLGDAPDLDTFLKVTVGVIKDLTQFHRVMVYQFDEVWNGQVVAELVDWSVTHDLYQGLHFPAGDIPAQARELYKFNKVRILYNRDQPTARIVVRDKEDLEQPLNMTHCYLRAMSPIHIKYLGNMGVRASMSVSIMAFGSLWGLVTCHSYGQHGMRVSFPVRQMLRLLSQSISRNIERLSYAQRLHTRKLINTISSDHHPTGYIVSNADDLLGLFDADFGILVIGDGAKILGPNQHGQEILIMAEYLRLKQYNTIQVSQAVTKDYPDLNLSTGLEVIAGLLCVPLSSGGNDFIAFLRKGQPHDVRWAGKPYKADATANASLEPRKSFRIWSETVAGRCRAWTDEQLETAGVLALVYGKFIEVWRQKESALQTTKITNLLLSNASHEVRTPLNHIINYLEMALNGPLDLETRDNLNRSHTASKNLLFTINDLLDLTRLESGNETSLSEPFNLAENIQSAVSIYRNEAKRRNIDFEVDVDQCPSIVIGDCKKIRTVVQNLTANALKYTTQGKIAVRCIPFGEPEGLRGPSSAAIEIAVADTGCGIPPVKLQSIFREIEQVESSEPKTNAEPGVGLGLAVVARIVEQLGGQLRVESKVGEGSLFSFLLSLSFPEITNTEPSTQSRSNSSLGSLGSLHAKATSEIDSIVEAIGTSHVNASQHSPARSLDESHSPRKPALGIFPVSDSQYPVRPIKVPQVDIENPSTSTGSSLIIKSPPASPTSELTDPQLPLSSAKPEKRSLRILIVEDNDINRLLLAKRLRIDGHTVVNTMNGQEGLDKVISDRNFDCVLMDINMPILNGLEASERIRAFEKTAPLSSDDQRLSQMLNGRMPIFAVSASLYEQQRFKLSEAGMDGWILKPIDFKRLATILKGVTDLAQRESDRYTPGCNWEIGGWLALSPEESPIPSPIRDACVAPPLS